MTRDTARMLSRLPTIALLAGLAASAAAQDAKPPPIPYVPSEQYIVERMLKLANVNENDLVVDLGSGDGRIPITAAKKFGARGFGVDINPKLVDEANKNAKRAGVADRVSFRQQDLFETPLHEATVVSLYLPVSVNVKLRPRLLSELRPGTRVLANQFAIGDWDSDVRELINNTFIHLWYVPAQAQGTWEVSDGDRTFRLHLWQYYQRLSGTAWFGQQFYALQDLYLRGDAINFAVEIDELGRRLFHGRIVGDRIEPREDGASTPRPWSAVRKAYKPELELEPAEYEW